MSDRLPPELRQPDFVGAVIQALARTYDANQNAYDPAVGHNPLTFGICVWQSSVYFLVDALAKVPGVTTNLINQSLEIRVGPCCLRVHKLGDSEFDDARLCFPGNAGPASRMGGRVQQLELGIILKQAERPLFLDWVIGHYGNPEDGLRAVRLQAVGSERALNGTISRWEDVVTVYDATTGYTLPLLPAATASDDVVAIPEPDIALQPDQAAPTASGDDVVAIPDPDMDLQELDTDEEADDLGAS